MAVDQERFSDAFSFLLSNGVEVYPVQMKNRQTGRVSYVVAPGGNTREDAQEVDEETMQKKVLGFGFAVRCSSKDGKTYGLYKKDGRSVIAVKPKKA